MWRTLGRAAGDTARFFNLDGKTIGTTIFLFAFGYYLYYRIKGIEETRQELLTAVIITVAPFTLFFSGLLLYHCVKAPYLLYVDEFNKAKTQIDGLQATVDRYNSTLVPTILTTEKVYVKDTAETERLNSEIIELRHQLDERSIRKQNREKVAEFLLAGISIKNACDSLQSHPELKPEATQWAVQTAIGLRAIDASYAARFQGAAGNSYSRSIDGNSVPSDNNQLWNWINVRTDALDRILDSMPN